MIKYIKHLMRLELAAETDTPEENLFKCYFVHHKPPQDLESNPVRRIWK
jgi:hypothetical protein